MEIFEPKGMAGGVRYSLELFYGLEEDEKGDPGEVVDGDVLVVCALGGSVQDLDDSDGERPQLVRRRIFFLI